MIEENYNVCEERKRSGFWGRKGVISEGGYRFHHGGIERKGYVNLYGSKVKFSPCKFMYQQGKV